jgi:hypothetical protein
MQTKVDDGVTRSVCGGVVTYMPWSWIEKTVLCKVDNNVESIFI